MADEHPSSSAGDEPQGQGAAEVVGRRASEVVGVGFGLGPADRGADGAGTTRAGAGTAAVGTGGDGGEGDVVAVSVAAYTPVAAAYRRTHQDHMVDRVERFAGSLPTPSLVLDAGCGPGRDMARFAALGHVVRGIDANPAFVAMAAVHAPTALGDLRDLAATYPPRFFDGVWACASLVHLPRAEAADVLGQLAGILRPVGRCYACVPVGAEGYRDEPDGRRWYAGWDARAFAETVASAGFVVDDVQEGAFVEVWATRLP